MTTSTDAGSSVPTTFVEHYTAWTLPTYPFHNKDDHLVSMGIENNHNIGSMASRCVNDKEWKEI